MSSAIWPGRFPARSASNGIVGHGRFLGVYSRGSTAEWATREAGYLVAETRSGDAGDIQSALERHGMNVDPATARDIAVILADADVIDLRDEHPAVRPPRN